MATATKAPEAAVIPNVEAPVKTKKGPVPSKVATVKLQKLMAEAHQIKQQMSPLEARLEVIKVEAMAEMEKKGVSLLTTKDGIPVVGKFPVTRWYATAVEEFIEKWPKLAAKFLKKTTFEQINWKKPIS
jgi:hypothetical protein